MESDREADGYSFNEQLDESIRIIRAPKAKTHLPIKNSGWDGDEGTDYSFEETNPHDPLELLGAVLSIPSYLANLFYRVVDKTRTIRNPSNLDKL